MSRHPDLLTRKEAAELLGVSPSRLARGWGPPPLPQYRRPRLYSRQLVERWLQEQREASWDSTSDAPETASDGPDASTSGGRGSRSSGSKFGGRLARQVA